MNTLPHLCERPVSIPDVRGSLWKIVLSVRLYLLLLSPPVRPHGAELNNGEPVCIGMFYLS